MKERKKVIRVVGTRGFPNIQGGVESHCQQLYSRLSKFSDLEIIVYRRSTYVHEKDLIDNITFIDLWAPKNQYFESMVHTSLCIVSSIINKTDVIHIHNIGPGVFIPICKLFGIKTVLTYHSQNYLHNKWNDLSKFFLKLCESVSVRCADRVIFIANHLKKGLLQKTRPSKTFTINNGITVEEKSKASGILSDYQLESRKYILAVGRLTEEKGFDYLIEAYSKLCTKNFKLVLVGGADFSSKYTLKTIELAEKYNVTLTGILKGEDLREMYSHARLFVLPSYHEGLPLAILEAMNYNLDILVSNIPANLELELEEENYFDVGNQEDLRKKLCAKLMQDFKEVKYEGVLDKYNWDKAALETYSVYKSLW
jgi:glycosyltransferase involved in cell wall biosynthesis